MKINYRKTYPLQYHVYRKKSYSSQQISRPNENDRFIMYMNLIVAENFMIVSLIFTIYNSMQNKL